MSKYQQAVDDWVARGEYDEYPTRFEKEPLKCKQCGCTSVFWWKIDGKWQLTDYYSSRKHQCLTSTVKFWKLKKETKQSLLKSFV